MTPSTTPDPSPPLKSDSPASGGGLPAKSPRLQTDQTDHLRTPEDGSVETSLELPHERDEADDMTSNVPDPQIEQAAKDVAQGRSDTSKATELDATYRKLGK